MIKVGKNNNYNVLKSELFVENEYLLGKYKLWKNTAMLEPHLCYTKNFGDEEDFEFCSYNSIWIGFNLLKNTLSLNCSSYGGLCGFVFSEEDLNSKELSKVDRECMEFAINLIKELKENEIIE